MRRTDCELQLTASFHLNVAPGARDQGTGVAAGNVAVKIDARGDRKLVDVGGLRGPTVGDVVIRVEGIARIAVARRVETDDGRLDRDHGAILQTSLVEKESKLGLAWVRLRIVLNDFSDQ